MKSIISILLTCLSLAMFGQDVQNVGVNKTDPEHPLDVGGSLNVDGNILLDGVQGLSGQIMQTLSNGETGWAYPSGFDNIAAFTQGGTFTVPDGVTKLLIEAWGAGGGGATGGGGAAGAYIKALIDVDPGTELTIVIGLGGANATTNPGAGTDGTNTTITGTGVNLTALRGKGAFSTGPGYGLRTGTSGVDYIQMPGQSGDANTLSYQQKNSTTFAIVRKYGDGGASGPGYSRRSQGQTRVLNESTGLTIESNSPTFAPYPGGGGGGGVFGEDGANGMVVIWY